MADYPSYGNQQNPVSSPRQNNDRPSITTSMFTLWDDGGNQLRLSCLDNSLSVAIWAPYFGPDGRRQYPPEQRFSTVLQARAAQVLGSVIRDKIVPAYDAGRNAKFGIYTNTAHSNMLEVEVNNGTFFITLYRGCDAMTHVPQSSVRFMFDIYYVISSFNPTTGEQEVEPIQADFFVFYKAIEAFNDLVGGSIAGHGVKMSGANGANARMMEYLRAISDQLHLQLPAPVNPNSNFMNPQQRLTYPQGNGIPTASVSMVPQDTMITEVSNISDLM